MNRLWVRFALVISGILVLAMILSTLLEGYRWTGLAIAGSALAMAGLVLAMRARSPSR